MVCVAVEIRRSNRHCDRELEATAHVSRPAVTDDNVVADAAGDEPTHHPNLGLLRLDAVGRGSEQIAKERQELNFGCNSVGQVLAGQDAKPALVSHSGGPPAPKPARDDCDPNRAGHEVPYATRSAP